MRVVGGMWRGKPLEAPEGRAVTRPTTDRVRESIASMVLSACDLDLSGMYVLDAFAGSGALGIEMLSRGASHTTFVDTDRTTIRLIKKNLAQVGASPASFTVLASDSFSCATNPAFRAHPFNLVLLDPPYVITSAQVAEMLHALYTNEALAPKALVVYERAAKTPELSLDFAHALKQKRYGTTCVDVLRVERSHE
ncbi:MAG: 16S rRNA (guanine(966)-N(2))-methyltransferase RsmD [Atopobium sp.]|uniref:16S rRNA (guanine(966)-N(2))-methyltransferase RsmD n=1 Tax=Atopobium sp. TaxID=1872650 RepID=UPI002A83600A|nr:16S rRNA (guanine(966)-N(2))-methyltransferase RsmD [Atopobium sp.]MDY4522445.1 16S rRNA (guanine(966)-N(2))-methyltransferase RsmD [Atopobium sp.]